MGRVRCHAAAGAPVRRSRRPRRRARLGRRDARLVPPGLCGRRRALGLRRPASTGSAAWGRALLDAVIASTGGSRHLDDPVRHLPRERRQPGPAPPCRVPRGRGAAANRSARWAVARRRPRRAALASSTDAPGSPSRVTEVHGAVGVDPEVRVADEVPAEAVGSATHALTRPTRAPAGSVTVVAPAASAAAYSSRTRSGPSTVCPSDSGGLGDPWATSPYSVGICSTSQRASSCPGAHWTNAISPAISRTCRKPSPST